MTNSMSCAAGESGVNDVQGLGRELLNDEGNGHYDIRINDSILVDKGTMVLQLLKAAIRYIELPV